ncbi:MAG: dehydrogenase protein [Phenylobacterium sp.]|jgi:NADH dehydrogenase|uniref:NAD(P)/FAD-dependent oxidoreductase n=1 Tax=Phenylobacterium sp. TaxID=1871053 RepID=UPI00261ADBE1|nr:NAD(P)/FAD-dependent oxidoreductase [Phenylobacterium sp.]MDB5436288.1 dehydrogenase protein [Phenylobacterium sp.]MDB5463464.1 dehydrogenase protein [Phenylobacterium sp.]MDB5499179.1 dehydrogenase protein [Phenylobacterium sp.]
MGQPAASTAASGPRVVIVGAGFGGLEAARALAHAAAEVVVIDTKNHHTFQPLLYQVATAALSPAAIAWPIRNLLKTQANAQVLMSRVTGVDPAAHEVLTDAGPVAYDQLVIAAGAAHSYFGHDDWAVFAPGLKSLEDALDIRRRILSAFERAELAGKGRAGPELTTFVVVGGGPTGVELAGSIAEIARDALKSEFRHIDPAMARIVLVEAGPRILPTFPENLAAEAARRLARYGVDVRTNAMVVDIDAAGVTLEDGRIDAATVLWGAGVRAAALVAGLPGEHDRAGRVEVAPDLSLPGHPDIFVVGDGAAVASPDGQPVPGIAPAAKQMGGYVGHVIAARLSGRPPPPAFRYRHAGDLATIGRGAAVVKLGRIELTGLLGWLFWGFIHVYFLVGLRARFFVALDWLWSYVTYHRGARLITGA